MSAISLLLAISFLPFFEARNQAANFIIHPPEPGARVSIEKPTLTTSNPCPSCKGKCVIVLKEPDFGQNAGRLGSPTKKQTKCPLCKGRGQFFAFVDPEDIEMAIARDHEKFVSTHRGKGDISVGEAFVGNEDYDTLDKEKTKLIKEAFGKPCPKCHWSGIESCKKCSGNGFLPCPENECKGGFLVTKTTTERTRRSSGGFGNSAYNRNRSLRSSSSRSKSFKETKTTVLLCPVCNGAKLILCPECDGRKASPCNKCKGLGIKREKAGD